MKGAQNIGDIEKIINLLPDEMNDSIVDQSSDYQDHRHFSQLGSTAQSTVNQSEEWNSLKLTYFQGFGRAEPIRMLLSLKEVPFDNIMISQQQWGSLKPATEFGGLPTLEINNEKIIG